MKWNTKSTFQFPINNFQINPKELIPKLKKELLNNRGVKTKKEQIAFLNPSLTELDKAFFSASHLKKAINRIQQAIKNNEHIIVYTDYDVDGITGGAIVWETLNKLSARVLPHVPDRFSEGYGLSEKGIDNVLEKYPDTKLIITVDQGITKVSEVDYAREKGIDVIITDHHTKPQILPKAHAIIYTTELSGSGVAYVFSRKLAKKINNTVKLPNDHIGLAAIGTIADLVPLTGANRVIAKFGLEVLNTTTRVGIRALMQEAGIYGNTIGPYEVGFQIGPRINAAGRLDHGIEALRLLCTKSRARAHDLAVKLDVLNKNRQSETLSAFEHAKTVVDSNVSLIFVADEDYHEGVIGLVAGQLVEEYYRPAIVVAIKKDGVAKASARSIKGINIIETIRLAGDMLLDVGGHPLAAGFSVNLDQIENVKQKLLDAVDKIAQDELFEKELSIDMEVPIGSITRKLYDALLDMHPHGVGNPRPVFVSYGVSLVTAHVVGRRGTHLKMKLKGGLNAIGFGMGDRLEELSQDTPLDIAYSIDLSVWNGSETLKLVLKDFKTS